MNDELNGVSDAHFPKPEKRALFKYWTGESDFRFGDPLALLDAIENHPEFNEDKHPQAASAGDREATELTLNTICEVFGVERFDPSTGQGLAVEELTRLWVAFYDFVDRLKKNTDDLPTPSQLTGAESISSNLPEPNTKPTAVSFSTDPESKPDGQTTSEGA